MTDKQPQTTEDAAAELRRLQAESEMRRTALLDELETLRAGYTAARLEIESLRAGGAEPAGAPQPGAAYAALPDESAAFLAWWPSVGQTIGQLAAWLAWQARASHGQAPAGESLRTDALCDLSYSHGLKAGWNCCASDDFAGFERAQKIGTEALRTLKSATAQPAPAAVAGPSGYGPKVTVKRRCSDCKACNSESYAVQGDSGHYVYCEHPSLPERKYIGDTHWDTPDWCPAAAPTTQPAPNGDEGISREQWIEQAMRVYLIAGDTEQQAEECAKYLWGELDMDDLADPYDAAMSDVEGRGPAPQQEAQEPVAGHCRFPGTVWSECSPEHVRMVLANPDDWKGYEVRYLYTAPQPAPQQEAQEPYSIDADPQGIRAIVADAITGVLAFGAQGTNTPPDGHWLAPFWAAARAEREAASQPSPAAQGDALDAARLDWLIEQDNCVVFEGVNGFCLCWIDEHDPQKSEYQIGTFPTARAAIDAARAAQEGK